MWGALNSCLLHRKRKRHWRSHRPDLFATYIQNSIPFPGTSMTDTTATLGALAPGRPHLDKPTGPITAILFLGLPAAMLLSGGLYWLFAQVF